MGLTYLKDGSAEHAGAPPERADRRRRSSRWPLWVEADISIRYGFRSAPMSAIGQKRSFVAHQMESGGCAFRRLDLSES